MVNNIMWVFFCVQLFQKCLLFIPQFGPSRTLYHILVRIYLPTSIHQDLYQRKLANQCKKLIIHRSVKFTYSMLSLTLYFSLNFSEQVLISHENQILTLKNFTIIDHCMSLFNVWLIGKFFSLKSPLTKIPIEGQIRLFINCYFVAEWNKIDYVSLVLIPGIKIITSICIMSMFICVIINLISANIIFI